MPDPKDPKREADPRREQPTIPYPDMPTPNPQQPGQPNEVPEKEK